MPSQSDVRKRRLRAQHQPAGRMQRRGSRRDRQRRLVFGALAVLVVTMMVATLAVGLFAY